MHEQYILRMPGYYYTAHYMVTSAKSDWQPDWTWNLGASIALVKTIKFTQYSGQRCRGSFLVCV